MTDAIAVTSAAPPGRQLARISGIPVRVTAGSLLLAAWLTLVYSGVLSGRYPQMGATHWPTALLFPATFAASVLLHEAGHAAVARRCGLRVRWIVVDGLGGETEFDQEAATPAASALVAAAGPAVSLALALILGGAAQLTSPGTVTELLLMQAAIGNALIAIFNLLPGLPLDGGYLLRALVWKLTGNPGTGTTASAAAGLLIAAAMFIVPIGLLINIGARPGLLGVAILLLVAGPIATGAWSILREQRLPPDPVSAHELARPAVAIHPAQPVREAIRQLTARGAAALIITDPAGVIIGLTTEDELAVVPAADRELVSVGQLARPLHAGQIISPTLSGDLLRSRVRETKAAVFVLDYGDHREPRVLLPVDALPRPGVAAVTDLAH
ncbi:MAG: site-2 protease family protein [Actinobacteria bacterium]|nr:site-2 protease family protein [Actinomycetota bacterium]